MTTLSAWTETFRRPDGGLAGVLAALVGDRVAVLAIGVAPDGGPVTVRQAVTAASAYGASAESLADLGRPFLAGARERLLLGLVDGDAREVAHSVASLAPGLPPLGRRDAPGWGNGRYDRPASPRDNGGLRQGGSGADARHGVGVPHLALRLRGFAAIPESPPPPVFPAGPVAGARRGLPPSTGLFRDVPGMMQVPLIDFLRPWLGELGDAAHGHLRFLVPSTWTDATLDHFGAPGRVGTYRRQAGALYPAFVPLLVSDGAASRAVDGGRPFEDALLRAAAALLPEGTRGGLTPAKLRRMRALPPQPGIGKLAQVLSLAARLPLHALPSPDGWAELAMRVGQVDAGADALGLPVRDLIGPRTAPWPTPGREEASTAGAYRAAAYLTELSHARDMADRCAETLVAPLLHGSRSHPLGRRLASRLLFGGLDVVRLGRLSRRWHLDLATFESALPPPGRDGSPWPALFPPFEAPGGLRVECLTSPGDLREEGAALRHCIGGYALACYCGESHVAGVRRGGERISTVSLQPMDGRVAVLSHHGARNAEPAPEAVAAVGALVRAVMAGTVSLDPAAARERGEEGYDDGRDWEDPGTLARAVDAWRPYLPSRLSRSGPVGVRTALAALAGAQAAEYEGTGLRRSGSAGMAQEPYAQATCPNVQAR